jgi:hypothetical protein
MSEQVNAKPGKATVVRVEHYWLRHNHVACWRFTILSNSTVIGEYANDDHGWLPARLSLVEVLAMPDVERYYPDAELDLRRNQLSLVIGERDKAISSIGDEDGAPLYDNAALDRIVRCATDLHTALDAFTELERRESLGDVNAGECKKALSAWARERQRP